MINRIKIHLYLFDLGIFTREDILVSDKYNKFIFYDDQEYYGHNHGYQYPNTKVNSIGMDGWISDVSIPIDQHCYEKWREYIADTKCTIDLFNDMAVHDSCDWNKDELAALHASLQIYYNDEVLANIIRAKI